MRTGILPCGLLPRTSLLPCRSAPKRVFSVTAKSGGDEAKFKSGGDESKLKQMLSTFKQMFPVTGNKKEYRFRIPELDVNGYLIGGTIELTNIAQQQDNHISLVMAKTKLALEDSMAECYVQDGRIPVGLNKLVEEKINQKLVEDPTNNYSMVLNMRYVKKLSPTEVAERIKKNMRQKKIMQEKEELKKKTNARIACHVAVAILAVIAIVIVPKELVVYITGAMQIYIMWSFPR